MNKLIWAKGNNLLSHVKQYFHGFICWSSAPINEGWDYKFANEKYTASCQ